MEALHSHIEDPEERRRKARVAGFKLLIGGLLGLPAYAFASLKTFGHFKTVPAVIAITVCVVFVALGTYALIKTRR